MKVRSKIGSFINYLSQKTLKLLWNFGAHPLTGVILTLLFIILESQFRQLINENAIPVSRVGSQRLDDYVAFESPCRKSGYILANCCFLWILSILCVILSIFSLSCKIANSIWSRFYGEDSMRSTKGFDKTLSSVRQTTSSDFCCLPDKLHPGYCGHEDNTTTETNDWRHSSVARKRTPKNVNLSADTVNSQYQTPEGVATFYIGDSDDGNE